MPKPSQSGFKRFFYNQNIKRDKSSKKYKNLIDHVVLLLKKLKREGMNAWLADAFAKAQKKTRAYGLNLAQILLVLERKGLQSLGGLLEEQMTFVKSAKSKKMEGEKSPVAKKSEKGKVESEKAPVAKEEKKVATKAPVTKSEKGKVEGEKVSVVKKAPAAKKEKAPVVKKVVKKA